MSPSRLARRWIVLFSLATSFTLLPRAALTAVVNAHPSQLNPYDPNELLERLKANRLARGVTDGEMPTTPSHAPRHAPPPPPTAADGTWEPIGIGPHGGHAAVYDAQSDEMVVCGGDGGYNDVWAMSLSGQPRWRLVQPSVFQCGTDGLQGVSAIYDPVRDRLLMFGGVCYFPDDYYLYSNSVTALPLSQSSVMTPVVVGGEQPCARESAVMAYDSEGDRMLVLGGYLDYRCNGDTRDVYALSLSGEGGWKRIVAGGTPPSSVFLYAPVYDPVRNRLIVFGGVDPHGLPSNSVWALSLSGTPTWTQLAPTGFAPPGRWGQSAIYDAAGDRMIIFGGQVAQSDFNDAWALSLSGAPAWEQLVPAGPAPSARHGHTAIYDPVRRRMIVYGGENDPAAREVWALSLSNKPSWTLLAPAGALAAPPAGPPHFPATYDPGRNQIVFFGTDRGVPEHDVTTLSLSVDPVWTRNYVPDPVPDGSAGSAAIYDPVGERIVMFGGDSGNGTSDNDTWALSLARTPTWSQLQPAGTPPPARSGHTAVYDPLRQRLITFGGHPDGGQALNDVWALALSGAPAWTELQPLGTPPTKTSGAVAVYDAPGDRVLVYIGDTGEYGRRDVWALSLSGTPAWTQLHPPGPVPDDVALPTMFDPSRDRLVVYNTTGFCEGEIGQFPDPECNAVWALSAAGAPSWATLSSTGSPAIPESQVPFYDSVDDKMVIMASGYDRFDIRALVWGRPPKHATQPIASNPGPPPPARLCSWELNAPLGSSSVEFVVPQAADVTLTMFDVAGRKVAVLAQGRQEAGRHQVSWSASRALPLGVYMLRLSTPVGTLSRSLVLLK